MTNILKQVEKNGLWGFINHHKQLVIDYQYQQTLGVYQDIAPVQNPNNNHWGYINTQGQMLLDCQYERADAFVNGLAIVRQYGLAGVINLQNQWVIVCQYQRLNWLSIGEFKNKKLANLLLAQQTDDKKYGIINTNNDIIIPFEYKKILKFWQHGKCQDSTYFYVCKNDKWGIIDLTGRVIISIKLNNINTLNEHINNKNFL
ncbi:WG repeat-containing protein [Psychrobacter sp. I-STPA6b]|uniref:WG repeat-containing protein n=1 Tax=Psychrobacter sp. I-STPA6b TaxID=2585718 RepID=UPI001D0CA9F4|nr:WG repeat-containing protein [Psychrobacter sp. I-STPA6b]